MEQTPSNIPNEETLEAIREVEQMKQSPDSTPSYSSMSELMNALLA